MDDHTITKTSGTHSVQLPASIVGACKVIAGPDEVTIYGALDGPITVEPHGSAYFKWSYVDNGYRLTPEPDYGP